MPERENEPQQTGMIQQMRQTFGVMHLVCAALSAPVAAMTCRPGTIGAKFLGLPMFFGAAAMLLVLGLVPPQKAEEVSRGAQAAGLVGFFAACLVVQRLAMNLRRAGAFVPHSMY